MIEKSNQLRPTKIMPDQNCDVIGDIHGQKSRASLMPDASKNMRAASSNSRPAAVLLDAPTRWELLPSTISPSRSYGRPITACGHTERSQILTNFEEHERDAFCVKKRSIGAPSAQRRSRIAEFDFDLGFAFFRLAEAAAVSLSAGACEALTHTDALSSSSVIIESVEYFLQIETRRAASRIYSFKFGGRLNRFPLAKHCAREGDRRLSTKGLPSLPSICLP